jgi:hypothetical protein
MLKKISIVFVFLLLVQACYLLGPSPRKRLTNAKKLPAFDVAIVPGLPLKGNQWDTLLKTRMLWSAYLYKKGYVKNIIYSGNAVYTKWVEGKVMAHFAQALGVPKENIFIDTLAEHSTENLYYGYNLAKEKGFKTIALATDPFQCAMLDKFSRKNFDEKIYFFPGVFDSIQREYSEIQMEFDTTKFVASGFIPIDERQNYGDRLKGTRGKNIKSKKK